MKVLAALLVLSLLAPVAWAQEGEKSVSLLSLQRVYPTIGIGYRWEWSSGLQARNEIVPELAFKYSINRQFALRWEMRALLDDPERFENEIGLTINLRGFGKKKE